MDLRTYQRFAEEYMMYPRRIAYEYPALGLVGEAGEVANKVKKLARDHLDPASIKDDIKSELGDVLWYVAAVATEFDIDLDEVGRANLIKLADRKARNVIRGSGDNR
jgi:NTP pyrophosphatase (non-canonical NTP hydrolase)